MNQNGRHLGILSKLLLGNPWEKDHNCEDNVRVALTEIGIEGTNWIQLIMISRWLSRALPGTVYCYYFNILGAYSRGS